MSGWFFVGTPYGEARGSRGSQPRCPATERPPGTAHPRRPELLLPLDERGSVVDPFPYDPPEKMPGQGGLVENTAAMTAIEIGYARVSTDGQDLTAQR